MLLVKGTSVGLISRLGNVLVHSKKVVNTGEAGVRGVPDCSGRFVVLVILRSMCG